MIENATITPAGGGGIVGEFGTWTLRLALEVDVAPGARLFVQLPNAWPTGQWNGAHGVHSSDPVAPTMSPRRSMEIAIGFAAHSRKAPPTTS